MRAILYHGRFHAGRGLEQLIQAMPMVHPRAILCLRGSGALQPALAELAASTGVADRVRFLPAVPPDRLVAELDGFSIGLVPYLPVSLNNYLCTPNKLFEYLMGGLAVVTSDLPELRRIVEGQDIGALCPPDDPRAIAAAINALLDDPERLARCRAAARRAALTRYNWEVQAAVLLDLYAALAPPTGITHTAPTGKAGPHQ